VDPSWLAFRDELRGAVEALVIGSAERYQRCWSTDDRCTLFGAFGGVASGSADITTRLDRVASRYIDGRYVRFDSVNEVVGDDVAFLAHLERIESTDEEGRTIIRERRVTHVARKAVDGWHLVHQHSDPLVEPPST
jgi:ketosteroid isomerase-like protein